MNNSVTYSLYLNSRVKDQLQQTEQQALSLDSAMSRINNTMRMFGLGFAGEAIVSTAKDWVESAARYQDAVNRIKFASDGLVDGAANVKFIREEADKFRIPLQEATDSYGKFLAMIQGSGIASDTIRKLHDDILSISKIKHIPSSQIDQAVLNLGKMMEAGGLDARHLRPFEQQLSGIGQFLASELGMSLRELRQFIHSGGAATIDPNALVEAIGKQAESLKAHLPEALDSLQSHIDNTKNAWLDFKNNLIIDLRPDLLDFFKDVQSAVKWLGDHREDVINFGKAVFHIAEWYLGYKAAMLAINIANTAYLKITGSITSQSLLQTSSTQRQTLAYEGQLVAINAVTAAIERLNFVQNASNASFITNSAGVTMANTAANRYAMSAASAEASVAAAGAGSVIASKSMSEKALGFVNKVFIIGIASEIMSSLGWFGKKDNGKSNIGVLDNLGLSSWSESAEAVYLNKIGVYHRLVDEWTDDVKKQLDAARKEYDNLGLKGIPLKFEAETGNLISAIQAKAEAIKNLEISSGDAIIDAMNGYKKPASPWDWMLPKPQNQSQPTNSSKTNSSDYHVNLKDKSNSIRGNSVTNIEIKINELNGLKSCTFTVKNNKDYEDIKSQIGEEVVKILTAAVNDSQLVSKNH